MTTIHRFSSVEEYTNARTNNYSEPWVSMTDGTGVNYNKSKYELITTPLTFRVSGDGEITWICDKVSSGTTIQYSKNGESWIDMTSSRSGSTIQVIAGDVIRFKGNDWPVGNGNTNNFGATCTFSLEGNPASLRYGENLTGDEELGPGCYHDLFAGCYNLIDASKLQLPSMSVPASCYFYMFRGCANLTSAPELPATTLERECYLYMFDGCTSLTSAPVLPATTLARYCYQGMFLGCTSLTSAPELPATTLANNCYSSMFSGCTSLTSVPVLPVTTLADGCYNSMFQGCTSLKTAPELPATTLARYCYQDMFYNCTNLTTAPELPATTLVSSCYRSMFKGCTRLNYVRCLATDISATGALSDWLSGVSSSGTFYKAAGVTYPSGTSGIPSGWTVVEV